MPSTTSIPSNTNIPGKFLFLSPDAPPSAGYHPQIVEAVRKLIVNESNEIQNTVNDQFNSDNVNLLKSTISDLKQLVKDGILKSSLQRTIVKMLGDEEEIEGMRRVILRGEGEIIMVGSEEHEKLMMEENLNQKNLPQDPDLPPDDRDVFQPLSEAQLKAVSRKYADEHLGINTVCMSPKSAKRARRDARENLIADLMRKRGWSRVAAIEFVNTGGLDQEKEQAMGGLGGGGGGGSDNPLQNNDMWNKILEKGPPEWFRKAIEQDEERQRLKKIGEENGGDYRLLEEFEEKVRLEKEREKEEKENKEVDNRTVGEVLGSNNSNMTSLSKPDKDMARRKKTIGSRVYSSNNSDNDHSNSLLIGKNDSDSKGGQVQHQDGNIIM